MCQDWKENKTRAKLKGGFYRLQFSTIAAFPSASHASRINFSQFRFMYQIKGLCNLTYDSHAIHLWDSQHDYSLEDKIAG